jgi:hypothetical protein
LYSLTRISWRSSNPFNKKLQKSQKIIRV